MTSLTWNVVGFWKDHNASNMTSRTLYQNFMVWISNILIVVALCITFVLIYHNYNIESPFLNDINIALKRFINHQLLRGVDQI